MRANKVSAHFWVKWVFVQKGPARMLQLLGLWDELACYHTRQARMLVSFGTEQKKTRRKLMKFEL